MSLAFNILGRSSDRTSLRFEGNTDVYLPDADESDVTYMGIPSSGNEDPVLESLDNSESLATVLGNLSEDSSADIFFLHQEDSWSPVQVTKSFVTGLIHHFHVMPEFLNVIALFKERILGIEETFSGPVLYRVSDVAIEIGYSYKYCEHKKDGRWVIRQTGIYHRIDRLTSKSTMIIVSPNPTSLFAKRLKQMLRAPETRTSLQNQPLLIHTSLMTTYMANWQGYLSHQEEPLLQMANKVAVTILNEPLRLRFDCLKTVGDIEGQLLPLEPVLKSSERIIEKVRRANDEINSHAVGGTSRPGDQSEFENALDELASEVRSYTEHTTYMLKKAASVRRYIADTLNIKFQATSQEQSDSMCELTKAAQHESTAIRVITLVTLFYLPFSFVATLMGMNLFVFDQSSRQLVVSKQFWLYFVISLPLTFLTLILWRWQMQRQKTASSTASIKGTLAKTMGEKCPEKMV